MSDPLDRYVTTMNESRLLRGGVEDLLKEIYKNTTMEDCKEMLEKTLPTEVVVELLRLIEVGQKETILRGLLDELDKLEVVKIRLAFDPSGDFLDEVVSLIREKIGSKNVVDVEVDHGILGGVILEVNGRFHDLSLKKVFENKYA